MRRYKDIGIQLQPRDLHAGGWKADFTLNDDRGPTLKTAPYFGTEVYATREDAESAALDSARRIIDDED